MKSLAMLILLSAFNIGVFAAPIHHCTKPKAVKPIENWDIIADNLALIKIAPYFKGSKLSYSISYNNIKLKNSVTIDKDTGEIKINAQIRDNFDLKVTAQNSCGAVATTFNVQIDEEE